MADVFLSYAREDHTLAELLSERIEAAGLTTWWDRNLLPGQFFDSGIEDEISKAKAVVVIWSKHSIHSRWVLAEANEALEQKKLVPIQVDSSGVPLIFRRIQTAQLIGWEGDTSDSEFQRVLHGLLALERQTIVADPNRESSPAAAKWSGQLLTFESSSGYANVSSLLQRGTEKYYLEYIYSGGMNEFVKINSIVVAKRGMFSSKRNPLEITLTDKSEKFVCIIQPTYRWSHYLAEKLLGIQVSIGGKTVISKPE